MIDIDYNFLSFVFNAVILLVVVITAWISIKSARQQDKRGKQEEKRQIERNTNYEERLAKAKQDSAVSEQNSELSRTKTENEVQAMMNLAQQFMKDSKPLIEQNQQEIRSMISPIATQLTQSMNEWQNRQTELSEKIYEKIEKHVEQQMIELRNQNKMMLNFPKKSEESENKITSS